MGRSRPTLMPSALAARTLREIALERKVLPAKELDQLLDYRKMTEPDA